MSRITFIETEDTLTTGPIDDPYRIDAGECPKCEMDSLWHYPEQSGACHSGCFVNHYKDHYACENEECLSRFVDKNHEHS